MSVREPAEDSQVEPVQVFVRIRPVIPEDLQLDFPSDARSVTSTSSSATAISSTSSSSSRPKTVTRVDGRTLRVDPPEHQQVGSMMMRKSVAAVDSKLFSYDSVFGESTTQDEVYSSVMHHVKATIRGYNTTIFALGCTGSGKTFTMTGNQANPGIVPRAISDLFATIQATAESERDVYFYVRVSLVELYNNNFRNLLEFASKELAAKEAAAATSTSTSTSSNGTTTSSTTNHPAGFKPFSPSLIHPGTARSDKIEVRESPSAGVYLSGQHLRIPVTTAQEAFQLISTGMRNRATGATNCNDVSSRSHSILTLHVESHISAGSDGGSSGTGASELRVGKMHLIDLAGSERLKLSGAEGETLTETQNINLSLTALGDVLAALSHNAKEQARAAGGTSSNSSATGTGTSNATNRGPPSLVPVPYRNSKLTYLLKDSLGGNSKTTMITTICTSPQYFQQTLISLNYASRAKKVRNRSLVNRDVIGDSGIHAVTLEIERLKSRLDERTSEFDRLKLVHQRDASENMTLKQRLQELNKMNEDEKRQLERQMSHVIHSQAGQLESQRQRINALQSALQDELALSHTRIAEQEREIKWLKKALDDSAQAVQVPVQQMERMQKVIEAWESQAKTAQSQLGTVSADLQAAQSSNATMRTELVELQGERGRMQQELSVWSQREAELRVRVDRESEARSAAEKARVATLEMCNKLQDEYRNREVQNADTVRRLAQSETDLRAALEASERIVAELHRKVSELEGTNAQLRERLNISVSAMELQLKTVLEESKSAVKQSELRAEVAERRTKSIEQELEVFKQKLSGVQLDTHDIVSQRDAKIVDLLSQLRQVHASKDEAVAAYESRLSAAKIEASKLQAELSQSDSSLTNAQQEISRKMREFSSAMETKTAEIESLRRSFADKFSFAESEYKERLSELDRSHHIEAMQLKQQCADEVNAAKEEFNRIASAEIQRVSEELIEVHNMSKMQVDDLTRRHSEELRLAREAFDASMAEADRVRKLEYAEQTQRSEAKFEAELLSLKHALDASRVEHESEVRDLNAAFAQELSTERAKLASEHVAALDSVRENMRLLMSKEVADCRDELQQQHQADVHRLQQKFESTTIQLQETHDREMESLRQELSDVHKQEDASLKSEYEAKLIALRSEAEAAMAEVKQTYQRKLKAASDNLAQQLDSMSKHREGLEVTMEELVAAARAEEQSKYAAALETELDALRQRLESERDAAVAALREAMQAKFDGDLAVLSENWRTSSEARLQEQLTSSLASQRQELDAAHDHKMRELVQQHAVALEALRSAAAKTSDASQAILMTQLTSEKESELRALEQRLTDRHEAAMRKASDAHNEAVTKLEAAYAQQLQDLTSKLAEARMSSSAQVVALQAKLSDAEELHISTVRDLQEAFDGTMARARAQFDAEKAAIVSRYESDAAKQVELLNERFEREMASLKSSHETHVAEVRAQAAASIDEVRAQYEARLRDQRTSLMSEKLELSESVRHELMQVQSDNRQALVDAEVRHAQQLESLLEAQKRSSAAREEELIRTHTRDMNASVTQAVATVEARHSEAIAKLALDHETRCNEIKTSYEAKLVAAQASHDSAVRDLQSSIAALRDQVNELNQLRKSAAVASKTEIASVRDHYISELEALKAGHSAEMEVASASLTAAHEAQIHELRHLLDTSELKYRDASSAHVTELASQQAAFEARLKDAVALVRRESEALYEERVLEVSSVSNDAFAKQLDAVRSMYETRITDMSEKHKADIAEALAVKAAEYEDSLRVEMHKARLAHEEEVARLRAEHADRTRHLIEQEREQSSLAIAELQRIQEQHRVSVERRLSEQQAQHISDIDALRSAHAQEVREMLESQERRRSSDLTESESVICDMRAGYEARIDALKTEVAKLCDAAEASRHAHALSLEEVARKSNEDTTAELTSANERALEAVHVDWRQKLSDALRIKDAEAQERLEAQLGQVVQQIDGRVTELQNTHRAERSKLNDKISLLEEELKSSHSRCSSFEARVSELTAELSIERTASRAQHDAEVEAMRQRFEVEVREATDAMRAEREKRLKTDAELSSRVAQVSSENEALKASVSQLSAVVDVTKAEAASARADHEQQLHAMQSAHDREADASSKLREQLESDLASLQHRLEEAAQEHEEKVSQLDARHSAEMDRLQSLLREESERYRQLISGIEGKRMDDLNVQVQELFKLMQSTYEESRLNVPKVEELHSKFINFMAQNVENKHAPEISAYEPQFRPSSHHSRYDEASENDTASFRMSYESQTSANGGGAPNSSWTVNRTDLNKLPPDQLTAAILEGDVQGIRTIVRSKGDSLHSPYWMEVSKSILPLHRAIAGLHFHGNDSLLIATIECLTQLGCNVKATDHAGNSCVHKAIQVCTSTSIAAVLKALLSKGASASAKNRFGDAPIHMECRRLRVASPEVIACLISHGADVNAVCPESNPESNSSSSLSNDGRVVNTATSAGATTTTPLALVLAAAAEMYAPASANSRPRPAPVLLSADDAAFDAHSAAPTDDLPPRCVANGVRRVWTQVAGALVRAGAKFDPKWAQRQTRHSMLHLLVQAFPPPRDQAMAYRSLVTQALKSTGVTPLAPENEAGQSPLHLFCARLGSVSPDTYSDAGNVLHALLQACDSEASRGHYLRPDRSGLSLLDLPETIHGSWLSLSRPLLAEALSRYSRRSEAGHVSYFSAVPVPSALVKSSGQYHSTNASGATTSATGAGPLPMNNTAVNSTPSSSSMYGKATPSTRYLSKSISNSSSGAVAVDGGFTSHGGAENVYGNSSYAGSRGGVYQSHVPSNTYSSSSTINNNNNSAATFGAYYNASSSAPSNMDSPSALLPPTRLAGRMI